MTRPQIKIYWKYLNRIRFKDLESLATIIWGYNPQKAQDVSKQRGRAEKWQEDPLYDFPNDIVYFTREQIENKIAVSRRFWNKIEIRRRWDSERGQACLGRFGKVARRCSMNDKLWEIWRQAAAKKVTLSLEDIKKMILIDIKRSKLYPPGWTDDTASPPPWYLKKLQDEGTLTGILKEIDEATRA
jgi:hypothetical protein